MIDWRMDVEKKLNNLVRAIRQDVTARGDKSALLDEPSVTRNADGSYTVTVFKADNAGDVPPPTKKTTTKRRRSTPPPDENPVDEDVASE